jgi:uncharacterized glyoxalase superfamily protein PhnB
MQTIFPILRYDNARQAIQWLCGTFGFTELFSVPELGEIVRHAQLKLGTNLIMLGSTRTEDGIQSPRTLGATTQALSVYVADIEAHYVRSKSAGAQITNALAATDFGSQEYHVRDIEDHLWVFSNFLPNLAEQ